MIAFEPRACSVLYNLLLSRQDERPFLLPANVCPIVPITFLKARRPFHLMDVASPAWSLDADRCLDAVRESAGGIGGVVFVRTYGAEHADPGPFFRGLRALQPDLLIVDDKCLCRPDVDGERLCPEADATLFSTGARKALDLGHGGFGHLRDGLPYRRHAGVYRQEDLEEVTRRYQSAVLRRRRFSGGDEAWLDLDPPRWTWKEYRSMVERSLPVVDDHRRRLNAIYEESLPEEVRLPAPFQGWRFQILVPRPGRLLGSLRSEGLFASRHYASLGRGIFAPGAYPQAESLHRGVVNLFNDGYYDEERARRTAGLVLRHLAETRPAASGSG